MVRLYILKIFASWYSISLNSELFTKINQSYTEITKLDSLSEYNGRYRVDESISLWINRTTGEIREYNVPPIREYALYETYIDAFLGIVEVMGTNHLVVVTGSEVVAQLDLGNMSFGREKMGKIMIIKEVKIFPMNFESEYQVNKKSKGSIGLHNSSNNSNINGLNNGFYGINSSSQHISTDEVNGILANIQKILSKGHYYSHDTDLTHTLQSLYLKGHIPRGKRSKPEKGELLIPYILEMNKELYEAARQDFNWCSRLADSIPKRWITVIIQGYVGYRVNLMNDEKIETLLIGRRNINRSGTRFMSRGIDCEGYVGNFIETELRIRLNDEKWYSYTQARGSVPLFWEQPGTRKSISLHSNHMNIDAFSRHVELLKESYEPCVYKVFVSLLDPIVKQGERILLESFKNLINIYNSEVHTSNEVYSKIHVLNYNYNFIARWHTHELVIEYILENLNNHFNNIGYFNEKKYLHSLKNDHNSDKNKSWNHYNTHNIKGLQRGILRTNCLDCLDRSNMFQWMVGWIVLHKILNDRIGTPSNVSEETILKGILLGPSGVSTEGNDLFIAFTDLWSDHGNKMSIHNSGTLCIISPHVKQKENFNSFWHYGKTMAKRHYKSKFKDVHRQIVFDTLSQYCTDGLSPYNSRESRDHVVMEPTIPDDQTYVNLKNIRKNNEYTEVGGESTTRTSHTSAAGYTQKSARRTLIPLDIAKHHGILGYDITFHGNDTIFIAKKGVFFNIVTRGSYVLWEPENHDYPDIVMVMPGPGGQDTLRVFFQPDPKFIVVDLKIRETTDEVEYTYDQDTNIHTFIPRYSHLIYMVINGGDLIWLTEDNIYSDKVIIFRPKNGKRRLRVYFANLESESNGYISEAAQPSMESLQFKESELEDPENERNKNNSDNNNNKYGAKLKPKL